MRLICRLFYRQRKMENNHKKGLFQSGISIVSEGSILFILLAKGLIFFMNLMGRGSSLPGKLLLKIDKNILTKLSRNYTVVLVTGTNGKTTTSFMIYNILKNAGLHVINNSAGANMTPGIVTCFVKNHHFINRNTEKYAIIEVDEAYLRQIATQIDAKFIVATNIFRDQLDRYGETTTTYKFILDGIKNRPNAKLILNGDEPMLGNMPVDNMCIYYGFSHYKEPEINANTESIFCRDCKTPYEYKSSVFNHLGEYACSNCGHARPSLDYSIEMTKLYPDKSEFSISNEKYIVGVPGLYNIYNALCAFTVASELAVDKDVIKSTLAVQESKFGRFETIAIDESDLKLLLIKNPAGCNQCIDTAAIDQNKVALMFMLNDKYADGTDVSWIYDGQFEKLAAMNYSHVIIGGDRAYDMAIRLKVAGLDTGKFQICHEYADLLEVIKKQKKTVYGFATYTAMTSFRRYLVDKGFAESVK